VTSGNLIVKGSEIITGSISGKVDGTTVIESLQDEYKVVLVDLD